MNNESIDVEIEQYWRYRNSRHGCAGPAITILAVLACMLMILF